MALLTVVSQILSDDSLANGLDAAICIPPMQPSSRSIDLTTKGTRSRRISWRLSRGRDGRIRKPRSHLSRKLHCGHSSQVKGKSQKTQVSSHDRQIVAMGFGESHPAGTCIHISHDSERRLSYCTLSLPMVRENHVRSKDYLHGAFACIFSTSRPQRVCDGP